MSEATEYRAVGQKLLVELDPEKKETEAGIVLQSDANLDAPPRGTIRSVGTQLSPDEQAFPSVGQRVVIKPYAGVELTQGETKFLVISIEDVLVQEVTRDYA